VIVFTLDVKNVVPDSLRQNLLPDRLAASFTFSSIGSGFVQIHHAFALDFLMGGRKFEENEVEVEFWDNNVIIQMVLCDDSEVFKTGLSVCNLDEKEHRVERERATPDEGIISDKRSSKKKNKKYKQEKHPKSCLRRKRKNNISSRRKEKKDIAQERVLIHSCLSHRWKP